MSEVRQVWLPGSGVWAALPAGSAGGSKDERSAHSGSGDKQPGRPQRGERQRGRRKRSPEPLGGSQDGGEGRHDADERVLDEAAAAAAGSPPAAAARSPAALTGYALQQDKEDSDVEEVEAAPTCPIVS